MLKTPYILLGVTSLLLLLIWFLSFLLLLQSRKQYQKIHGKLSFWPTWRVARINGTPSDIYERAPMFFFFVIVPVISFALTSPYDVPLVDDPWQSGIWIYPFILLGGSTTRFFAPLILYSIVSACLLLLSPQKFGRFFAVRLGIYTGVLLALQYTLILNSNLALFIILLLGCTVYGLAIFLHLLREYTTKIGSRCFYWSTCILLLYTYGLIVHLPYIDSPARLGISNGIGSALTIGLILLFCSLVGHLNLIFPFSIWWSTQLWKHEKAWSFSQKGVIASWFSVYIVASYLTIKHMFEIYNALPTSPSPTCYIATAAAQGYPRLVGSFETATADGQPFRINRQVQRLKAAELLLLAIAPNAHRSVRKVYDVWGRYTAQKITHPAVATLVYWSLKPAEWIMQIILLLLGQKCKRAVHKFYKQA